MRTNRVLTLAIVLSLVLNFVLLSRMGELKNQIQSLSNNYNTIQSNIHSISRNVNNTLTEFTKEQSWITRAQLNTEKTSVEQDKGLAVFQLAD